ncbi:MAG TPA: ketosteroid isomerase-related protein [Alphaproteobacteria bacterium]|nr:ketosteroid isomerase-related protein [Alphaproteobacteria bacterium]
MTQSAAEVIHAYYAAFNANDLERFLTLLSEDIVHDINQGDRETGRAAFASFMRRMGRCYRERIVDSVVFSEPTGKRVAAEFTVLGEYIASEEGLPPARGQRYRIAGGSFFEVRDGKIARVTNYYNVQDWLRQARAG